MKKTLFLLETIGTDRSFEGYTEGEDWNGWACPYFTFEVGQQIVEALKPLQTAFYDEAADEFVFDAAGENDPDTYDRFGAVETAEIGKLYPIGAMSWIWEEEESCVV